MTEETKDTSDKKAIGVVVPRELHDHIALQAVYLGISKSEVMRNALQEAFLARGMSINQYVKKINRDLQIQWDKIKEQTANDLDDRYKKFIEKTHSELETAGVEEDLRILILNIEQ